jgi:uncharacterized repeat protein (TIGR03803 family)
VLKPPRTPGGLWVERVLYAFTGGADGGAPTARLTWGKNGVLYGTTVSATVIDKVVNGGSIFSLTPPVAAGGSWTETVLTTFDPIVYDASYGHLLVDKAGALYGTLRGGGGAADCGAFFKLVPPTNAGGSWTQYIIGALPVQLRVFASKEGILRAVWWLTRRGIFTPVPPRADRINTTMLALVTGIYDFTGGSDGAYPNGDLLALKSGLYGTTEGGGTGSGTVFWLAQPATSGGSWTEGVLHAFAGGSDGSDPRSGLLAFQGAFFGTTAGGGTSGAGTVYVVKP